MHNVTNRRRIRFHDLRHTHATLLLMQGESPVYVKDRLGHSSIKMTVDIYGHWIPGANRRQPAARPPQCYTDTSPSSRRLKIRTLSAPNSPKQQKAAVEAA
jgi:hypothetical protein